MFAGVFGVSVVQSPSLSAGRVAEAHASFVPASAKLLLTSLKGTDECFL